MDINSSFQVMDTLMEWDVEKLYRLFVISFDSKDKKDIFAYGQIRHGVDLKFDMEDVVLDRVKEIYVTVYKDKKARTGYAGEKRFIKIGAVRFEDKEQSKIDEELENRKRLLIRWIIDNTDKAGLGHVRGEGEDEE